jgi:hypothetical protein
MIYDIKPSHFERICPHGIGHPDPDDMAYWKSIGEESMGVHGCDGCCAGIHAQSEPFLPEPGAEFERVITVEDYLAE